MNQRTAFLWNMGALVACAACSTDERGRPLPQVPRDASAPDVAADAGGGSGGADAAPVDDAETTADAGSELTLDTFPAAYAAAFCALRARCAPVHDLIYGEESCELAMTLRVRREMAMMVNVRERVQFEAAAAAMMVEEMPEWTCDSIAELDFHQAFSRMPVSFSRAFSGRVPEGGACASDYECASGGGCAVTTGDACGTCAAPIPNGGRCRAGAVKCENEMPCHPGETCAPYRQSGEDCLFHDCAPGLSCVLEGNERVCRPHAQLKEPCNTATRYGQPRCDSRQPLACEGASETMAGVCRVWSLRDVGQTCQGRDVCRSSYCAAGACRAWPVEGEPCLGTFGCASGALPASSATTGIRSAVIVVKTKAQRRRAPEISSASTSWHVFRRRMPIAASSPPVSDAV